MVKSFNVRNPLQNISVETLKSAFEASRSPLIITDHRLVDDPIVYSNQAFVEMTGYRMDEIIGKNCRFLQGEDTDPEAVNSLRQAVKNGQYMHVTLKNYRKNGSAFWNDLVLSPITDADGATTHFMGMQLDMTDRISTTENLLAKTHELEISNQELEQFTFAVSHDLQEPLRMISSYLQLLMKRYGETFDADALTFMGFATEGADRMQTLIYDLLTLSRVTTNKETFMPTPLAVPIERALFNLKASVEENNVAVTTEPMPTLSIDAVQITQLFQNLIGNAIKYRQPNTKPIVTITGSKQSNHYVFSVTDNGIGIDPKHFKRIFQVFQRLHTRSEYQGTGVGLAICSKIVDRHGGRMWVKSKPGKGSTFFFTLPSVIDEKGGSK